MSYFIVRCCHPTSQILCRASAVDEVTSDKKHFTSTWMLREDHRQWASQKKRGGSNGSQELVV